MNENGVVDLLESAGILNITVWVGGGWGVSALVGYQVRKHNDIDVYIDKKNAHEFISMLTSKGYKETKTEYTTASHTVWQDSHDHNIDLHLLEFKDEDTESLYFEGEAYPLDVLSGQGKIGKITVKCFSAEAQLLFHQGYEQSEKDIHDVLLLCKTFGIDIPEEYQNFDDNDVGQ